MVSGPMSQSVEAGLKLNTVCLLHSDLLAPEPYSWAAPSMPQTWRAFSPSLPPHIFSISGSQNRWTGFSVPRTIFSPLLVGIPNVMVLGSAHKDPRVWRRQKPKARRAPGTLQTIASSSWWKCEEGPFCGEPGGTEMGKGSSWKQVRLPTPRATDVGFLQHFIPFVAFSGNLPINPPLTELSLSRVSVTCSQDF